MSPRTFPCTLRRQHCLVGPEFAKKLLDLQHEAEESMSARSAVLYDLFWDDDTHDSLAHTGIADDEDTAEVNKWKGAQLSLFERIVTSHPPILESLISQLPTASVLDLFHTSRYLRDFLRSYPLAWRTLSFRLPQPPLILGSPGLETPDTRDRQSRQHPLDYLLVQVVVPVATRLKSLDLCNTTISGVALISRVLQPRLNTIQHLSVRGCKNVSIKYHIVPFLQMHSPQHSPWMEKSELALKSLYTYRCRHHRRRPYLSANLMRRDSDSEPTHELIEICHQLGIWTDTAWCPTPGGRCFRRKDYHSGRAAPGTAEVWVPFDRLWRSGNRIGPTEESSARGRKDGRLWEDLETGHDGEPLGPEGGSSHGEGKGTPTHLRRSHRTFVEDIKCDQCGDQILERCEQCSVRMHCMGCRKTLCASCAFNRPIPKKRAKTRDITDLAFGTIGLTSSSSPVLASLSAAPQTPSRQSEIRKTNRFWWAPGATRSPNLMTETASEDDSSDSDDANTTAAPPNINISPPKLNMHWCCLEPIFSGGGGIAFLGPGLGGNGADRIRAAPLPRAKGYEDPDFTSFLTSPEALRGMKNQTLYEAVIGDEVDILPYLTQDSTDLQTETCPRCLCQDCYRTFRWKVSCKACKKPLCKEHDFRALKIRRCGFRNLEVEREFVQNHPPIEELEIPAFKPPSRQFVGDPTRECILPPVSISSSSRDASVLANSTGSLPSRPNRQPSPGAIDVTSSHPLPSSSGATLHHTLLTPSTLSPPTSRPRSQSLSSPLAKPSFPVWSSTPHSPHSPHAVLQHPSQHPPQPQERLPLPCHPRHPVQWEGCGAYFCQQYRPVGDSRPRCPAALRECKGCGVWVCEACLADSPPCLCGACAASYHCPHCALKPAVRARCRREEEQRARLEAEMAERQMRERAREEQARADEVLDSCREFLRMLPGIYEMEAEAGAEEGEGEGGVLVQLE